jgi:hypothetical protein
VENNRDIFVSITFDSIESDRKKLKDIKSLSSFKTRRDKFHAHFDKDYAFQRKQISKDAPIKRNDLDEVIDIMKGILNKYSAAYDGQCYSLEPWNINDVDDLLDILYQHNQNIKGQS